MLAIAWATAVLAAQGPAHVLSLFPASLELCDLLRPVLKATSVTTHYHA